MKLTILLFLTVLSCAGLSHAASSSPLSAAITTIRAVGPEGRGNVEANQAWKKLGAADAGSLLTILAGMDGANDLAVNWLRAAVDAIAARELDQGRKLPVAALETFVHDTQHHPRARRLAYELIAQTNPDAAQQLIAGLRDDPSTELRRDAVQGLADEAAALRTAGKTNEAIAKYQVVIRSARDVDQVESIAAELKKLGQPVKLPAVFGWLTQWKVIGPFDSTGGAGHEKVYPPEERIDLAAEYDGKAGKVHWQDLTAVGDYGLVDLNKPCGALKEVAGYAYSEFDADKARPVELRLGCKNAWKVWLNGKLLFGRDEYHRGMEIDQYRMTGELKPGKNTILVKICQNEQKEAWTVEWEFQLRITDALGTPILSAKL
jgi:hypothetical protein